ALSCPLDDGQVIERVRGGDLALFEVLMRRYNQRTFRVVRSIVSSDAEAEDVTQEAWIAAYRHLHQFEGRAAFSTWLTRIAIRRAMAHTRRGKDTQSLDDLGAPLEEEGPAPDHEAHRQQLGRVLEHAIDELPPGYRLVIILRDVEQLPTAEAAEAAGVTEQNLRVRLHRARAALKRILLQELDDAEGDVFSFAGERCDRMVVAVLTRIYAIQS
ncbi:MAG: RNA polymerase sigma factor, partial [Polyangiales bacterium]